MRRLLEELRKTAEGSALDEGAELSPLTEKFGEPAKVGEKRKWKRGEMQKTKDGWQRIPGSGPTPGGRPAPPSAKAKPAPAAKGAKPASNSPPAPASATAKKPKPAETRPPKADKPQKDPEAPADTGRPEDVLTPPEDPPEHDKAKKEVADGLMKHQGGKILKSVKGVWKKAQGNWKKTEFRQAATENFMSKVGAEVGETVKMTWTFAKMLLPGVSTTDAERKDAFRQVFDLAKTAFLASNAVPLGITGAAMAVVGISPGKMFDALLDKPLRAATKIAFGEESGILPSRFYAGLDAEKKPAGKPKAPKKPKEQTEWTSNGQDINEPAPGDDIDLDAMIQGSTEEAQQMLQSVFEKIMDVMGTMEPDDEDVADALVKAGLSKEDLAELTKWHDYVEVPAQKPTTKPPENKDEFRRLAGFGKPIQG